MLTSKYVLLAVLTATATSGWAAVYPSPMEGDYVIRDFRFRSGESLPQIRMHYRVLGEPQRDAEGVVRNAVLVLHGTTGTGAQFLRAEFAGELFGQGQLLDAIRSAPDWQNGEYQTQPHGLRIAAEMLYLMGSNPTRRFQEASTLEQADRVLGQYVTDVMARLDATDVLYAFEASRDYDPGPGLETIEAPLVAINFADDLINPPALEILEGRIQRVKHGKAMLIPESDKTNGHRTHTLAAIWKDQLAALLEQSQP